MKKLFAFLALFLFCAPAFAVEELTLTAPVTRASTTKWQLSIIHIERDPWLVSITFVDPDPTHLTVTGDRIKMTCIDRDDPAAEVPDNSAKTTIQTFNITDFRTNSVNKRLLNWATAQGCLSAGTVSGTPD